MPQRLQLSRAKGFKLPVGSVSVARPGRWGNPFRVEVFGLERSIALFENTVTGCWSPGLFNGDPDALLNGAYRLHREFLAKHGHKSRDNASYELRGKNLACWCRLDQPHCHAEVLLRLANRTL